MSESVKTKVLNSLYNDVRNMAICAKDGNSEEISGVHVNYDELKNLTVSELAEYQNVLRSKLDSFDRAKKELQKVYDIVRNSILAGKMEEEGIKTITVENVGRVCVTSDVYASIKVENKERAYQFLRDTGNGDIIKDTINSSSLKSVVKSMLREGIEIPENTITYSPFLTTSITKVK